MICSFDEQCERGILGLGLREVCMASYGTYELCATRQPGATRLSKAHVRHERKLSGVAHVFVLVAAPGACRTGGVTGVTSSRPWLLAHESGALASMHVDETHGQRPDTGMERLTLPSGNA